MHELPEVETVRRMLDAHARGRTVGAASTSRLGLRSQPIRGLERGLRGRRLESIGRHGKYLLFEFERGVTMLSHLGMSGRWLFFLDRPEKALPHVHARLRFDDGSELWFQDPRRFGQLRLVRTAEALADPSLAILGPDPIATPPTGRALHDRTRGARVSVKSFLLDQRRIAGIGNIYASEILFRAKVDPRRRAGNVRAPEWDAIAAEIRAVLTEAIDRMGTTFSAYRTLWNEPGQYGGSCSSTTARSRPCRRCGARFAASSGPALYLLFPSRQRGAPPARPSGGSSGARNPR